jgi:hypothetical protein
MDYKLENVLKAQYGKKTRSYSSESGLIEHLSPLSAGNLLPSALTVVT